MAFIIKDRVKVNTTTTGTGDLTLGSAVATFDTFQSYMSDGDTTYYAIVTKVSNTDEWEVGIGTWNTGNTLTRTTVLAGSNGTSAVNFTAGDKDVFMTYPASKAVYTDASGNIDINGGTIDGATVGATSASTGKFTTLQTTSNADIGGYIDLEILSDHAAYQEGRVWYDSLHKTLNFYSDVSDVVHELGIEEHQRVYNNTGSTISKGAPLYFSGNYTAGTLDVPTVGLADATDVNAYNAQGLAAADIADGSYGYCIIAGQLTGLDTSALTAGTNFFVGLTPGAVQNASPTYPNYPMCLGWVVNSDATDGILLVNQQNHSVNSFRVRTDAHIGGDFQVDGDLTVLGTTTSVSTSDVTAGAPFYRANEGDAIGEAGTTFNGSGLDDAFFSGHFTGTTSTTYYVKIDGTGTPDTFSVSTDNFATTISTGNAITGSPQLIHSADNIYVEFGATTGHTLNDVWTGTASPINVDTGFFSNRNTGTSGVGYTHVGFYFDVSEGKWVLLDEYDPTPSGTINLADSSTSYGILKVDSVEGNLTGNVTGNVSGNATTASSLATSRNIGGVAFNGTADINLPGVNTSGNQDTSGNAATATALATARTIQLSGDVTGSASFDGSADINITAAVQDDSHAHVISNVDGLQTALDGKTPTTRTITAGNGLTGGGNLSANRTLNVGAGTGVTVNADTVSIGQDVSTTADVTFNQVIADNLRIGDWTGGDTFAAVSHSSMTGDEYMILNNDNNTYISASTGADVIIRGGNNVSTYEIKVFPDAYATAAGSTIITEAGSGLVKSSRTLSHADTSSQASVDNSNGTVIQDVTLDGFGHVTGLTSVNLDGRYYTESEADSRFVNVTGDTMTGALTLQRTLGNITHLTLKQENTSGDISSQNAFIDFTFIDANANGTPQVRIGANVGEDGGDANTQPLEGSGEFVVYTATGTSDTANSLTEKFRVSHDGKLFAGSNRVFTDGYHPNADKWTTSRTLSLSGDASGSVSWDGSANATLSVTVANDSHTHSNYVIKTGDTMTGRLYIDSASNDKLILRGSNDPSMELQNASDAFRGRIGISNTGKEIRVVGQDPDNTNNIHILGVGQNGLRYSTNNGSTFYKVWHANNDGSGSGLDADTLDGSHASSFASASHNHNSQYTSIDEFDWRGTANLTSTTTSALKTELLNRDVFDSYVSAFKTSWSYAGNGDLTDAGRLTELAGTSWLTWTDNSTDNTQGNFTALVIAPNTGGSAGKMFVYNDQGSGYAPGWREIWTSLSDGSGSGLDADLLDGVQGSSYLRSDAADTTTGTLTISTSGNNETLILQANSSPYLRFKEGSNNRAYIQYDASSNNIRIQNQEDGSGIRIQDDIEFTPNDGTNWYNIWTAWNDGSGSGLDADLLDGNHASAFQTASTALGYVDVATNDYGTIKVDDDRGVTWAGYAIRDDWVFMSNGANEAGIYNDTDNEWGVKFFRNAEARLYYNGSTKLDTTSAGVEVTGDINSTSDIRYKKNIETIDSALEKVQALRGVTFDWDNDAFVHNKDEKKPDFTERATGVIAQDVEKVLPEAVRENEDGFKNVAYGNMVGLLIEAIKEQQQQINELREKLNA